MIDDRLTRFSWLRQFEPGNNSAVANRLMDRLEFLQRIDLPHGFLEGIPAHRITRLRRHGEHHFADGLRELPNNRRLAILAACVTEWHAMLADAVVETNDRIVGRTYRTAQRLCEARIINEKTAMCRILRSFVEIGGALICAQDDGTTLDDVIALRPGWEEFRDLVAVASKLADAMSDNPLNHVVHGYHRFRLYARRMLRLLDIDAAPASQPLLAAVKTMREGGAKARPVNFLRPQSKWRRLLHSQPDDVRLWETAVLFHVRNAFRSDDIWLKSSRRYADLKQALVPTDAVANTARISVPLRPEDWLADRRDRLSAGLKRLGQAARTGTIPGGSIESGMLQIDRLPAITPFGIEDLILDLYKHIPDTRITTILSDVDSTTGFSEAFTHLRTGVSCKDRVGLLNVVEAQAKLPMAAFWGLGLSASSDGQFFPTTEEGEAMNLVNAKYGHKLGLKA